MVDRTPNYNLELVEFDKTPWHSREHNNWRTIDAVFANFITINNMKGVWLNATTIAVGDRYVDSVSGTIWTALVAHTTSSTLIFSADRAANTTYWELYSDVALAESWATSLAGLVNSTDYSSKAYAVGTEAQTPVGSAKSWAAEPEDTEVLVGTGKYSALHYAAKAGADAIATAADKVATNADAAQTALDRIATAADVVSTNADAVSTAADAVSTAADAATATTKASEAAASAVTALAATIGKYDSHIDIAFADSPYTVGTLTVDTLITVDTSSGNVVINLPQSTGESDNRLVGINKNGATNTITTNSFAGDTVGGAASFVQYDDTEWADFYLDKSALNWQLGNLSFTSAGTGLTKTGSTISISDNGVAPSMIAGSVNAQTGTTYTLVLGDAFKTVTMSNASANILTVPTNASVAFSIGDRVDIIMYGAGVTSITGDTGVTINGVSAGSGDLAQYGAASLLKIATNEWLAVGITVA
jgi:hypothetical protein